MGVTRLLSEPAGLGNHGLHVRLLGAASTPAGSSSPGRGLLVPAAAYPQSENSWFNLGEGEAAADPRVARSAQGRCRYCQDFKVCLSPAGLPTRPQPMAGHFSHLSVLQSPSPCPCRGVTPAPSHPLRRQAGSSQLRSASAIPRVPWVNQPPSPACLTQCHHDTSDITIIPVFSELWIFLNAL